MYRFRYKNKKHPYRRLLIVTMGAGLLILIGFLLNQLLHPNTSVSQSAAVTSQVIVPKPPTKVISTQLFSFVVPKDWNEQSHATTPYDVYSWVNSNPKDAGRTLTLYYDTIPKNLGVNTALQVQTDGTHITPVGSVSDNCSTFTKPTTSPPSISTPAIWNGLSFLCDLGNSARDVVGTVSADGLNRVVLSGPKTGKHALFFTYNEQNIQPDYDIFTQILTSFRLK